MGEDECQLFQPTPEGASHCLDWDKPQLTLAGNDHFASGNIPMCFNIPTKADSLSR